jgi:hypothetical protein
MEVLDRPIPSSLPEALPRVEVEVDERAARRSLRAQIARLDCELTAAGASAFPTRLFEVSPSSSGPGMLTLGELEDSRDALAARLAAVRKTLARRDDLHERKRRLLEQMMLEPSRHKFARVTREEVGESGCGGWEVRPWLGLLGMLAGWWRVKLSSGCPLAIGQLRA